MQRFIFVIPILILLAVSFLTSAAQTPDELQNVLSSLGFRVSRIAEIGPTDWEASDLGLKNKRRYSIKSVRPVRGERALSYRYAVDIETYPDQVHAQHRLERILAAPPGPNSKMEPEYDLREAFRRGNSVYIVSTNVYKFVVDRSLSRLRAQLENAVPDFGDHAYPHVRCGPSKVYRIEARCKSVVNGKKRYFSHLLTFDVVKVLEGEFTESEITLEAKPSWVKARTVEARLVEALGVKRDGDLFQCDSNVPVILSVEREFGDRGSITRTTLKDFSTVSESPKPSPGSAKPATARDYFMLISEDYFVLEGCNRESDAGCEQARLHYLKQFVEPGDITGKYIKGGCDGAQKCMEMAVFETPDGTHIIGLGVFHEGLKESYFLKYRDGVWMDISSTIPKFSNRNYYELSRDGVTVGVFEGKVVDRGADWEAAEKGKKLYDLELKDGSFVISQNSH